MWFPTERKTVVQAMALTNGAMNTVRAEWPLDGCGISNIRLTLHATLGWTDAVAVDRCSGYNYLKGVTLKTSRGEVIYNNVPGRAIFEMDGLFDGIPPKHDLTIGADATYHFVLDLPIAMPFLNRPEDTVLDTGRYSGLELIIYTGSVLDFVNDATGETIAVTMDVEVERSLACLADDGKSRPHVHTYITPYPHQLISTREYYDIESAMDFGIFGFFLKLTPTGWTCPFEGPGVDNLVSLTFRDSLRAYVDHALPWSLRQECNQKLIFDPHNIYIATPAATEQIAYPFLGIYPHFFVKYGSMNEAFSCGKKSMIRVEYDDATTTDYADLLVFGYRTLRG